MHVKGNVANTYMHFGFVYVEYIQEKSHLKKNQVHLLGKKKKTHLKFSNETRNDPTLHYSNP